MTPATLGALLLVAILALAATCAVLVYIEHRRDLAWEAEQDALDADADWLREVAEMTDTPIFDATCRHIALMEAASIEAEWREMQG